MKKTSYICDFCLKGITSRNHYTYRGKEFDWLFDYDDRFHLHQSCIDNWRNAKEHAKKAAREAYEAFRKNLI